MTKNQFHKALVQMGITQIDLANKLQTNERTVRRWTSGDWPVPVTIAVLINLMLDTGKRLEDLRT